jgi:hypothetical protein
MWIIDYVQGSLFPYSCFRWIMVRSRLDIARAFRLLREGMKAHSR